MERRIFKRYCPGCGKLLERKNPRSSRGYGAVLSYKCPGCKKDWREIQQSSQARPINLEEKYIKIR